MRCNKDQAGNAAPVKDYPVMTIEHEVHTLYDFLLLLKVQTEIRPSEGTREYFVEEATPFAKDSGCSN